MYKLTVRKMVERDNFFNGCEVTSRDLGVSHICSFKTLVEVLSHIKTCFGSPYVFDDHLMVESNEDDDCNPITLSENNPDGWLATYNFYITKVEESDVSIESIKVEMPDIEEA